MGSRQTFEEVNVRKYELPNEDFLAVLRALHLPSLDLSLPPFPSSPPPGPSLEAELEAFGDWVQGYLAERAIWGADEKGLHFFCGELCLPYEDPQTYLRGAHFLEVLPRPTLGGALFRCLVRKMAPTEDLHRPLGQKVNGFLGHFAFCCGLDRRLEELFIYHKAFLLLRYPAQNGEAWSWLLYTGEKRAQVHRVLNGLLLKHLAEPEVKGATEALVECLSHRGSPFGSWTTSRTLLQHRLKALDPKRWQEEEAKHPGFLEWAPLEAFHSWEAYRWTIRRVYGRLEAQGLKDKDIQLALGEAEVLERLVEDREGRKARALVWARQAGIPAGREKALGYLLDHLVGLETADLSQEQESALQEVIRAYFREADFGRALPFLTPLLRRALEEPTAFQGVGKLGLVALARKLLSLVSLLPGPMVWNDLEAHELLTPEALEAEGRAMRNCLRAEDWAQVAGGDRRFFSARRGEKRVATFSLSQGRRGLWEVEEVLSHGNAPAPEDAAALAHAVAGRANQYQREELV